MSQNKDSGEELFRLVASGDEQAFARLHAAYKDRLLFYGKRFMEDWEEVQDIVSEAFLKLWTVREQMQSDTHLRNFLFRAVRHRIVDRTRAQARKANLLEGIDLPQATDEQMLEAELVRVERVHLLTRAADALPDKYKRIFELAYQAERNDAEIAHILELNPGTVRSQKRRAIDMIRKWIRDRAVLFLLFAFCSTIFFKSSKKNIPFFGTNDLFIRNNNIDIYL